MPETEEQYLKRIGAKKDEAETEYLRSIGAKPVSNDKPETTLRMGNTVLGKLPEGGLFGGIGVTGRPVTKERLINDLPQNMSILGGLLGSPVSAAAGSFTGGFGAIPVTAGFTGFGQAAGEKLRQVLAKKFLGEKALSKEEAQQKINQAFKTGALFGTIGESIAPLQGVLKSGLGQILKYAQSRATGTSVAAVQESLKSVPAFAKAMRGQVTEEEILKESLDALRKKEMADGAAYRAKLSQISKDKQILPIGEVKEKLAEYLESSHGITVNRGGIGTSVKDLEEKSQEMMSLRKQRAVLTSSGKPLDRKVIQGIDDRMRTMQAEENELLNRLQSKNTEGLDFSNSTLKKLPSEQKRIRDLWELVSEQEDATPLGMDKLRRNVDNLYHRMANYPVEQSNAAVAKTVRDIRDFISGHVPGYDEMLSEYSEGVRLRKQIVNVLSLRATNKETAMSKLRDAFLENKGYRRTLLDTLDKYATDDLKAKIAGLQFNPILPTGIRGMLDAMGLISSPFHMISQVTLGHSLPVVAATSPRLAGESNYLLGKILESKTADELRGLMSNPDLMRTLSIYGLNESQQ